MLHSVSLTPVTPKQLANRINKKGRPARRAAHGQWVIPAEAVYSLVKDKGWNVSDAVREVVKEHGFKAKDGKAFNGIRAAYYVMCNRKDAEFVI